jgi:methylenetetrahydrofolate dehydrogenase (NADP+) / methenyltetrahydrofolate cyclohydrolase
MEFAKPDLEPAKILGGSAMAAEIIEEIREEVAALKAQTKIAPGLAAVSIGEDLAGQVFLRRIRMVCDKVGMTFLVAYLPSKVSLEEIQKAIHSLNNDLKIHGIIILLPIPEEIDVGVLSQTIDYRKDIDGLHPQNIGKLLAGTSALVSATLAAITEILSRYKIDVIGKRVLVIGREEGFAKPLAMLMVQRFATVSVITSWDNQVEDLLGKAEIVITDLRKPKAIKASMLADDAIVIDMGFNIINGKLVGDIDLDGPPEKNQLIVPVPGGVGPLIISMMLKNTLVAYRKQLFGPELDEEIIWRKGR